MYGDAPVFKILLHAYALYCDLSVDFRLCVIMNIFGEHVQNRYLLFTCNTDNSACMTWVGVLQRVMEMSRNFAVPEKSSPWNESDFSNEPYYVTALSADLMVIFEARQKVIF